MSKQRESTLGRDRYRAILENIAEGYFEVDLTGTFTFSNPSMAKILGLAERQLLGMNYRTFMNPENVPKAFDFFHETFLTGRSTRVEGRHVRSDGTIVEIETSITLLRDEEGRPSGFSGIVRDISERLKMERQLIQMHKMEAVGTLAGGIAHEFNNLLMGIQGNVSLLRCELNQDHPCQKRLDRIEEQVRSGADLTQQLLGFAREGMYEVKPVDLAEVIKRTSQIFGRSRKAIAIVRNFDKPLWTVEVDQGQMEQVLMGLYLNAWEAMPGGGTLTLDARNVTLEEGGRLPYGIPSGSYVKVSVRDTGIGMDEKTRQRVFEPFFTTKEMGRGAGLGLASTYGIIKGHGGFIDVRSCEGEGTVFDLYLPASLKKAKQDEKHIDRVTQGQGTILLVDDEEVIVEVSREILEMLGYQVLTARTGYEAVEIFSARKDEIDLIILDMIMPGMGGGETFDRLKTIQPGVKVILSTGYSLTGEAREIMGRGCRGFIQKPFRIETLSQKIREVFGMKAPEEKSGDL